MCTRSSVLPSACAITRSAIPFSSQRGQAASILCRVWSLTKLRMRSNRACTSPSAGLHERDDAVELFVVGPILARLAEAVDPDPRRGHEHSGKSSGGGDLVWLAQGHRWLTRLAALKQLLDVGHLQLDIGRAVMIALSRERRLLHVPQKTVHLLGGQCPGPHAAVTRHCGQNMVKARGEQTAALLVRYLVGKYLNQALDGAVAARSDLPHHDRGCAERLDDAETKPLRRRRQAVARRREQARRLQD